MHANESDSDSGITAPSMSARTRGLRPWRPGQSGNPSGRPRQARGLREALRARYGVDGRKLIARLDELSQSKNERVALHAVELTLAYLVGRPSQSHESSGEPTLLEILNEIEARRQVCQTRVEHER